VITQLNPYRAYQDSDVPWLGDIPAHWQQSPGRVCFVERKTPNVEMQETTVLSLSYGQIVVKPPEKLHGLVPASFETYQIIEPYDIVIRPTDLQNDWVSLRTGLARTRGIITSAYMRLRTKDSLVPEYGRLVLHAYDLKKVFYGLGSGLRQNLSWRDFKYLPCLVPPPDEQAAIVRFLNHIDRRTRRYIRAKSKLIALLEEQKQAIIQRTVTRGLDPNVRLKPSGVKWLGEVPDHWEVRRLRNVAKMRVSNVDKHTKEGEVPVRLCNYVDVYKNDRITDRVSFMRATATPKEIERFRLEPGDVLITKDSEAWNDIGVPALVEYTSPDVVCGYHLALLRPLKGLMDGAYLLRALQSPAVAYQHHVSATGVTRYGLSHHAIKSVILPLPPLPEQSAIVRFLDEATVDLEHATAAAQREISLLREYRTRLIADVVTGKLDVRQAAANLPVEAEDLDNWDEDAEEQESGEDLDEAEEKDET